MNDYFSSRSSPSATAPSDSNSSYSLFHGYGGDARDIHFDPLATYLDMREELLSGPNPLADLDPAAVGGLVFEAHQAQSYLPNAFSLLQNDIAPHIDASARAAGLLVWLRLDLEAIATDEDRPERFKNALGIWAEFDALVHKHRNQIEPHLDATLEPELAIKLWKGLVLGTSPSNNSTRLDQGSLRHLWELSQLSDSRKAFDQPHFSVISILGVLAEASGDHPQSAFQHISKAFLVDMKRQGILSDQQIKAASIRPYLQQQQAHAAARLSPAEEHLITFFRCLVLSCSARERYSDALSALLALLQKLSLWDRSDATRQRILPDQQPLVSHLLLKAVASEQAHMVEHVASVLLRTSRLPNAFQLASNRQLLFAFLDLTLSPSSTVSSAAHFNKVLEILDRIVPDLSDNAQRISLIALFPPRLLVRLLSTCRILALDPPANASPELRLRCDAILTHIGPALTRFLINANSSPHSASTAWTFFHQRMLLAVLCSTNLDPSQVAASAMLLYNHLRVQTASEKLKISSSELLQLVRYATRFPEAVEDGDHHKFGHQIVSDFFASRAPIAPDAEAEFDHVDLTALASACFRLGFCTAAANCYSRMLESRIIPSWQDINALLGELARDNIDQAKAALLALKDAGFQPDASTYVSIVSVRNNHDTVRWAIETSRARPGRLPKEEPLTDSPAWIDMRAGAPHRSISLRQRIDMFAQSLDARPSLLRQLAADVMATHEPDYAVDLHSAACQQKLVTADLTVGLTAIVHRLSRRFPELRQQRLRRMWQNLEDYPILRGRLRLSSFGDLEALAMGQESSDG